MPSKPTIPVICQRCSKEFLVSGPDLKRGGGRFCAACRPYVSTGRKPVSLEDRFWKYVNKDGPVPAACPELGPCWLWTGALNYGYGRINIDTKGAAKGAHVVSLEMSGVEVPAGMQVLHHCDVRNCVNPRHLYVGDIQQNMRDRHERERDAVGEANGKSVLTSENVQFIRAKHVEGWTIVRIARELGANEDTVRMVVINRTWKDPAYVPQERGQWNAILQDDDIRMIRSLHNNGWSYGTLAERFNVSKGAIRGILQGRTWKHVQ
jgi:hypothetical protein